MLDWSTQFETGNAVVDSQHRMFIAYVDRLGELTGNRNPSKDEVELFFRFMDFLDDYIITHFRAEEECMYRFRCPAHRQNLAAHQEFLDFFSGYRRRLELAGYTPEVARELHAACVAWIRRHILAIDAQLQPASALAAEAVAAVG